MEDGNARSDCLRDARSDCLREQKSGLQDLLFPDPHGFLMSIET